MRFPRPLGRRLNRQHGYSLLEIAIVLMVIGVVMGGLWVAANSAWDYTRREEMREDIATTIGNARSYFSAQVGVPATAYATLTNQLLVESVIPSALKRQALCGTTVCADHLWGSYSNGAIDGNGTFRVCSWQLASADCSTTPAAASPFFAVELTGLQQKQCIAITETMSSANQPTGLVEINLNGTNLLAAGKVIQPVSDADVLTYCATPSGQIDGSSVATFVYRVVAPP